MDEHGEQGLERMETRAQQFVDPPGGYMLVETYLARDVVLLVAEVRRLSHCAGCGQWLDENYCLTCD